MMMEGRVMLDWTPDSTGRDGIPGDVRRRGPESHPTVFEFRGAKMGQQ